MLKSGDVENGHAGNSLPLKLGPLKKKCHGWKPGKLETGYSEIKVLLTGDAGI
jgi:hypothetical protein